MIEIEIFKENNLVRKLEARGHAFFGKRGRDIVCAAISTLVQNIYTGLLSNENVITKCIKKSGLFCIEILNIESLKRDEVEKINFLINTTIESIRIISLSYSNRIKIYNKEVLE